MLDTQTIAVIGGTGKLGSALATLWSRAGYRVVIGSREAAAAQALAATLGSDARGLDNAAAAAAGDIVVVTVPFAAQAGTLAAIAPHVGGKLVVDTTVPLMPPRVARVQLPPEGSAAQRAQSLLGPETRVVAAFHSVAAHKLATGATVDCDALVFGEARDDRAVGVALAKAAGMRGLHGGGLANAAAAEAMTSVLIFMNKFYAVDGAGLMVTGALVEPD